MLVTQPFSTFYVFLPLLHIGRLQLPSKYAVEIWLRRHDAQLLDTTFLDKMNKLTKFVEQL